MKTRFKLLATVAISLAAVLYSCTKDSARNTTQSATEISTLDDAKNLLAIENHPDIPIKIGMKPYRPVTTRERDGKTCDCKHCFGLCDFDIIIGGVDESYKDVVITLDEQANKATIYFIENLNNFETEFGVDFDIDIPNALNSQGENVKILSGLYTFNEVNETITHQGTAYVSYGKAEVNVSQY